MSLNGNYLAVNGCEVRSWRDISRARVNRRQQGSVRIQRNAGGESESVTRRPNDWMSAYYRTIRGSGNARGSGNLRGSGSLHGSGNLVVRRNLHGSGNLRGSGNLVVRGTWWFGEPGGSGNLVVRGTWWFGEPPGAGNLHSSGTSWCGEPRDAVNLRERSRARASAEEAFGRTTSPRRLISRITAGGRL
jgi:hypothetical protein